MSMNDRDERGSDVLAEEYDELPNEADVDLDLNEADRDPTAGASDIGGRAGSEDDDR